MNNRVVITGLGVVSPIGIGLDSFEKAMMAGKCGIDFIKAYDATNEKVKLAAEILDFDPQDYFSRKQIGRMDRFVQLGIVAAREAVKESRLNLKEIDLNYVGVSTGTGVGGIGTLLKETKKLMKNGLNYVNALFIPKFLPNILTGNIAIEFGAMGPSYSPTTACAAGTDAIGIAYKLLKYGEAKVMIAGGAESCINPLMIAGFTNMNALTQSTNPKKASMPFDVNRSGFVLGEGAGMLVLETLEHALERKANILGEILGYGQSCDAYHLTSSTPGGAGAIKSMANAIDDANLKISQIDSINTHGTSTLINDKNEVHAIMSLFKEHAIHLPVNSTKSMIGHLQGASGAVEAIGCILELKNQYLHPTIGTQTIDPDSVLDYLLGKGRPERLNCILSNSFGFGGHNSSIVFANNHSL
ncbi:beta-ketoacyl-ACP synthase II [Anaerophilus nitritogenes]|uniref:beta-ketoacyl-ACP synthase II n=1 Tax=Anaerophilus nitritogenes TaxID=2498136 RepID=UPI00101BF6AC|nr:beta-ketoacyl-ACP synthase II [Anaerophilus nitritogenes]